MADILVIEDEQLIARLLKETLEMEGYQVAVVLNGKDAIPFALHEMPHLIIVDVMLPIMDGYEATRRIRSNPDNKSIPIIAITSYALSGDEGKALAAGCDAYVAKPYSPRQLLAKIREYLQ